MEWDAPDKVHTFTMERSLGDLALTFERCLSKPVKGNR